MILNKITHVNGVVYAMRYFYEMAVASVVSASPTGID